MMRIAVVGARGQLGSAVVAECARDHEVLPFDRRAFDLTDDAAATAAIEQARPGVIVNCAGYNDVDGAESHPVAALQANAMAVRTLARAARLVGAVLVQYSTDFVFDGAATEPMTEDRPPKPRSAYAASKLLGEWFAEDAPAAYVLRVESLFGAGPGGPAKGSLESIVQRLRAGEPVRVFSDRTVSPTYVIDAARATRELLERRIPAGTYHCVNSGAATWLEVAAEAARQLGVDPKLEPVRVADVKLPAQRPQYCALSPAKLAAAGIVMPDWRDALERYLRPVAIEDA
jgi:dTDP-4-dehydrorhamnose reductase